MSWGAVRLNVIYTAVVGGKRDNSQLGSELLEHRPRKLNLLVRRLAERRDKRASFGQLICEVIGPLLGRLEWFAV